MVLVVVIVGIGVLGLAALAASGKLGAMPPPVNSRPVGRLPEGELTNGSFGTVRFRTTGAGNGYASEPVDKMLDRAVAGTLTVADLEDLELPICTGRGYAFDEVDHVVEQLRAHLMRGVEAEEPQPASDTESEEPSDEALDAEDSLAALYAEPVPRTDEVGSETGDSAAASPRSEDPAEAPWEPVVVEESTLGPLSEPVADADRGKSAE